MIRTQNIERVFPVKTSLKGKRKIIGIVIAVLVMYGSYAALTSSSKGGSDQEAQEQLATTLAAVSEHMTLPEDDEPVLSVVTDAKALIAEQAFFAGVVDGDQVLLFPKNLKAIIYSPSRDRIINVGPIEQGK